MIIGLLGILKAGGAPLRPLIPTERLVFMLQDARASVILTQQHLAERFEAALLVCLDSDWDAIAQQPDENLLQQLLRIWSMFTPQAQPATPRESLSSISNLNYLHSILED